ncbi:beta-ketoacyl synthase chain length factor [Dyella sp. C9]|uniref:beta-ketoacyl synthase chain length factor n=1 Tax=Dyella sp. C9 TaxID=2202154 RepID=UPI000DEFBC90|nr:beta-ketoacyl synthase chain length factor [Dyella sp. C9]
MIDLHIAGWRAWAPGLDSAEDWQSWARSPWTPEEGDEQPDCSFLPAMQRRRLSRMARIALHAAWPLCGDDEQLPLVSASRHGETTRTYAILGDVADGQPLSPTHFGLSVHNAIAGQWSILRGQRGESTAIAGEADTFEHAMLEAAILIEQGAPAVIVVLAEECPPAAYAGWIDDVPFSYAVALRVGAGRNDAALAARWRLSLASTTETAAKTDWPFALDFVRALHAPAGPLVHTWKTRQWIWQPNP